MPRHVEIARTHTVRRRKPDKRSPETRRKLIEAAVSCICEFGAAGTTMFQIAKRAGMSRGALQHQFKTRIDFMIAVLDHLNLQISEDMRSLAQSLPKQGLSLERRLDAVIHQYWKFYTSSTYLAALHIFVGIHNDAATLRRLQRRMLKFYRLNDATWVEIFSDAGLSRAGVLVARRVLVAALRGLAVARVVGTQPEAMGAEFQALRRVCAALFTGEKL